jgi:hypothetical protein
LQLSLCPHAWKLAVVTLGTEAELVGQAVGVGR